MTFEDIGDMLSIMCLDMDRIWLPLFKQYQLDMLHIFSGIKLFLSLVTDSVIPYNVHVHIVEDKADKLVDGKEDGKPTYSTIAQGVDLIFDNANIRWVYIANDW